jgi:peptidylprolyl isomerase
MPKTPSQPPRSPQLNPEFLASPPQIAPFQLVPPRSGQRGAARRALIAFALLLAGSLPVVAMIGSADDPVVAKSDGVSLRASDVRALLDNLDPAARDKLRADPQLLARALRQELGRKLVEQQAVTQHWEQKPEVKAQLERARSQLIVASYLDAQAEPPSTFPSEAELQQAYKLNQQRFMLPRQFHLAQIYVALPADANARSAAQARAGKLAAQARSAPAKFAALAASDSGDKASLDKGGDLGWLAEDQITPEVRSVVAGLAAGEVSEVIPAADGWHIVRLIETRPAAVAPLEQVKPALSRLLRQQRAQENATAYMSRLLNEQHVAIDEISLGKVRETLK